MSIESEARTEAIRRYGVVDESGHLDYDGAAFVEGYIAGASRPVTEEQLDAFRKAWWQADDEGDTGNRVRRGLEAASEAGA